MLADSGIEHNLTHAPDGEVALAMLHKEGGFVVTPRPDIILLDLGLPMMDGREVLSEIKADNDLKRIPVFVLTVSTAEADVLQSYDLLVHNYLVKPPSAGQFQAALHGVQPYLHAIRRMFGNE